MTKKNLTCRGVIKLIKFTLGLKIKWLKLCQELGGESRSVIVPDGILKIVARMWSTGNYPGRLSRPSYKAASSIHEKTL